MHRLTTSFLLGYHGCSQKVANALLAGEPFVPSENSYDWLGPGIYFWQANPLRALRFAEEVRNRRKEKWTPAVVGAVIEPGLCLDLASEAGVSAVTSAFEMLVRVSKDNGDALPINGGGNDLLLRNLDCAVIKTLHAIRADSIANHDLNFGRLEPIDTVSGIFVEGKPIYLNSGFHAKTHIQICVCNSQCIRGVFRVPENELIS
jgi:hypothetical protein